MFTTATALINERGAPAAPQQSHLINYFHLETHMCAHLTIKVKWKMTLHQQISLMKAEFRQGKIRLACC